MAFHTFPAPDDAWRALLALTVELRHLPLDDETREVHVRAFELRRRMRGMDYDLLPPEERGSVLSELTALRQRVRIWLGTELRFADV